MDAIVSMVSTPFYSSQLANAPGTDIRHRALSQEIIQYLHTFYKVNSPFLLLQVKGKASQDSNKSRYNVDKASVALNLGLDMIQKMVIQPRQRLIMASYRAQFKTLPVSDTNPGFARTSDD